MLYTQFVLQVVRPNVGTAELLTMETVLVLVVPVGEETHVKVISGFLHIIVYVKLQSQTGTAGLVTLKLARFILNNI